MAGMQSLSNVRNELLDLHRALIDAQRADYERERGRVAPGEFLQTLINDPSCATLPASDPGVLAAALSTSAT